MRASERSRKLRERDRAAGGFGDFMIGETVVWGIILIVGVIGMVIGLW